MTRRAPARTTAALLVGGLILASAPASAQEASDNWPRAIDVQEGRVVLYQPQPESFEGDRIDARFAVSVTLEGADEPAFGVAWVETRVATDRDARTVDVLELEVERVRFPNSTPEQEERLAALLEERVPQWEMSISLDRLLASLEELDARAAAADGLNHAPPVVIFASEPTVLVTIDGEPILQPIEGTSMMRVVNTPFTIALLSGSYWLYAGDNSWYRAPNLQAEWTLTASVPSEIRGLQPPPPEDSVDDDTTTDGPPPAIVVATEPTELLVTEGPAEYSPLGTSDLLYLSNSESDVLLDLNTQQYWTVLSGRWYRADSLTGDWAHVAPDELPEVLRSIPPESEMGHLLLSIPGTVEAEEALMDHQIPQTSAIRREDVQLVVEYDGAPQFERIEDSRLAYAVNTATPVIRVDGRYYACSEAVWYVSDDPEGGWVVADSVPDDIYEDIPADVPIYNVTYVHVFDATPEVVYVGYYPGYTYSFVYGGTIVYGTGWYYRPWYGSVYYPYHSTWGFHVRYNPWYGWSVGFSYSRGPFTFAIGWGGFHPHYGGWWGPIGFRGYHAGYHRGWHDGYRAGVGAGYRAGFRAGTRLDNTRSNIYQRDRNARRNIDLERRGQTMRPQVQPGARNDVFADRDGNVFRNSGEGWQSRDGRAWTPPTRSGDAGAGAARSRIPDRSQLDRSAASRSRGNVRSRAAPPRGSIRRGGRGRGRF